LTINKKAPQMQGYKSGEGSSSPLQSLTYYGQTLLDTRLRWCVTTAPYGNCNNFRLAIL